MLVLAWCEHLSILAYFKLEVGIALCYFIDICTVCFSADCSVYMPVPCGLICTVMNMLPGHSISRAPASHHTDRSLALFRRCALILLVDAASSAIWSNWPRNLILV